MSLALVKSFNHFPELDCFVIGIKSRREQIRIKEPAFGKAFCLCSDHYRFFIYALLCCRQHKLDAVKLIDLRYAGVIIHSNDVCLGICLFQYLDDTLTNHMVWQARKGLDAHNIRNSSTQ